MPASRRLGARPIGGVAVFGIGSVIADFFSGVSLPALGTGGSDGMIFVAALIAGILATKGLMAPGAARTARRQQANI